MQRKKKNPHLRYNLRLLKMRGIFLVCILEEKATMTNLHQMLLSYCVETKQF